MLCVSLVVLLIPVKLQNTTFLAMRIGRSSMSLDSARFWDNAVCVVAYKMTSTNMSGLFGHVGDFSVARETFGAYVERMEMVFYSQQHCGDNRRGKRRRQPSGSK